MLLYDSMKHNGQFFFKHRGIIPVFFFVLALILMLLSDYSFLAPSATSGSFSFIAAGLSVLVSALGLLFRCYTVGKAPDGTSGRNSVRQEAAVLNTSGAYSMVRNPLYFSNFLIWFGLVLYSRSLAAIICVTLLFLIFYERIILVEESYLTDKFGREYLDWAGRTPAFFPNFFLYSASPEKMNWKKVILNESNGLAALCACFWAIDYWLYFILRSRGYLSGPVFSVRASLIIMIAALCFLGVVKAVRKHKRRISRIN